MEELVGGEEKKVVQVVPPPARLFNPENTLYLPEGSVRAILALTLTGLCGVLLVRGILVPEWFIALTAGVFGYYFGGKNK